MVCGMYRINWQLYKVANGLDQKNEALIPNETNKVRSHKNYPKYLEYNIIIHVGIMYKI
jgi:hypothetical protein